MTDKDRYDATLLAEHKTREPILSQDAFRRLADVTPEIEWFANLGNEHTRSAYRNDMRSFMRFVGITEPQDFRIITRSHVIAWRKTLEERKLVAATIRRKLSALVALFDYLCDANAILHTPVYGVLRPTDNHLAAKQAHLLPPLHPAEGTF